MAGPQTPIYKAGRGDELLVERLDAMAVIYQRQSGITHLVAEPIPEILEVMGSDSLNAEAVASRLAAKYDLETGDAEAIIASRLEEMALLGMLERRRA